MAFGLAPKHEVYFPLEGLTSDHFLVLAHEAVRQLNWNIGDASGSGLKAYTGISLSSYGEEFTVTTDNGFATVKSACTGSQFMDWGRNKRNVEKFLSAFDALRASMPMDALAQRHEALQTQMTAREEVLISKNAGTEESGAGFLSLFIPRPGYFVTPLLLDLNIILFVLMAVSGVSVFSPDGESLLRWGANFRPVTLAGEWWRLLTSCFVHIGIMHLLMNMYALTYIGLQLEPYLGKMRFAAAKFR